MMFPSVFGIAAASIQGGAPTPSYRDVIMADSPAAYWKLDEATGTAAADETGAHQGTYTNSPTLGQAGLVSDGGKAVSFDGTNYVATAWAGVLTLPLTIEAWIQTAHDYTNETNGLVAWGDVSTNGGKSHLRLNDNSSNGAVNAVRYEVAGGYIIGATPLNDGQPHHVVAVVNGPNVTDTTLYVDGQQEGLSGSSSQSIGLNAGENVDIGRRQEAPSVYSYFTGVVDEVAIYASALSAARVDAHYNAGL